MLALYTLLWINCALPWSNVFLIRCWHHTSFTTLTLPSSFWMSHSAWNRILGGLVIFINLFDLSLSIQLSNLSYIISKLSLGVRWNNIWIQTSHVQLSIIQYFWLKSLFLFIDDRHILKSICRSLLMRVLLICNEVPIFHLIILCHLFVVS